MAQVGILAPCTRRLVLTRVSLCPGNRRIECGADKGSTFDSVLLDRAAELGGLGGLSVFIGDSPSDLPPLIAADLGIVVGSSPLLRRVCAAAGVQLKPLSAGIGYREAGVQLKP